ncbi:MAG: SPOR domain-containing protein [Bacteroidales bacterium]
MAYLGTYIRQILSDQEPVVLPGFGSLIITEGKGQKGADGKVEPPGPVVKFDPTHPKGDGKLADVYAAGENIDPEEARQQLLELVDAIKFKLDKGEKYRLEQVGTFSRDDENRIHFAKDPGWVIDPDTFGLEPLEILELESEQAEKEEPVREDKPAGKPRPSSKNRQEPVLSSDKPSMRASQRKPVNKWKIIWIVVGSLIAVLVIILLIPSGNSVEFGKEGIVIRDMDERKGSPEGNHSVKPAGDDAAVPDRVKKEEGTKVDESSTAPPVQQNKYFIIAGSFQNLQNATNLMNKLKSAGFPAEMIITENRLYRVSIRSYAEKEEAVRDLSRLKAESGVSSAWVLKR